VLLTQLPQFTKIPIRSSSQSTLKPLPGKEEKEVPSSSSPPPSFPSIADLSSSAVDEHMDFKSLTAQKLMAGLSFNSVDTLLEVNAAAEGVPVQSPLANNKSPARHVAMDQSTETIDFGVI